jgi:uncharacterized membrane protein YhaH (DUF805 family)
MSLYIILSILEGWKNGLIRKLPIYKCQKATNEACPKLDQPQPGTALVQVSALVVVSLIRLVTNLAIIFQRSHQAS